MRGMLSWFLILLPFCVGRVEKLRSSVAKTFSFTQVDMSNAVVGMHSYYSGGSRGDLRVPWNPPFCQNRKFLVQGISSA